MKISHQMRGYEKSDATLYSNEFLPNKIRNDFCQFFQHLQALISMISFY